MQHMITNPILLDKVRSDPLLAAIERFPVCTLRIASFLPGHTCAPTSTIVPCHIRRPGTGMGTKPSELAVVGACQHCHDLMDLRHEGWKWLSEHYPTAVVWRIVDALLETHARLQMMGIIDVKGAVRVKGGGV